MELVKIGEKNLGVKEFEGKRVVTAWDVAEVHGKPVKRVSEQFERNEKYFIQGEDFLEITKEEFRVAFSDSEINIPNNVKMIKLFTESGYMMLVKTFTDEKSWQVQRELVRGYFMAKKFTADNLSAKERLELWRYFKKVYEQPTVETKLDNFKMELQVLKEISSAIGFTREQEMQSLEKICEKNGIASYILPDRVTVMKVATPRELLKKYSIPYGDYTFYRKLEKAGIIFRKNFPERKQEKDRYNWILKDGYWGVNKLLKIKLYEERFIELVKKIEQF